MPYRFLITARSFARYPGRHTEVLRESGVEAIVDRQTRPLTAAELCRLVGDTDAIIAGGDQYNQAAESIVTIHRVRETWSDAHERQPLRKSGHRRRTASAAEWDARQTAHAPGGHWDSDRAVVAERP